MKNKSFQDQTALLTGGASGIGKATAKALLEAGVGNVVIASRRDNLLRETEKELREAFPQQGVFAFRFDLRDRKETDGLVEFAVQKFGAIDILINNAGLAVPETIDAVSQEGWDQVIETNLRGAMWLIQSILPQMQNQDFGDIINISSQAGKNGYADVPAYCASKYGLLGLADAVRDHVLKQSFNIRIVNLCPALVDVETDPSKPPRPGFLHVRAMTQTILYALQLDRNVILHDIGLVGR